MLRLIVNRAKNHYNKALEHAERGRTNEAVAELNSALQLDDSLIEAHLLLGTLYARLEQPEEARKQWLLVLEHRAEGKRAFQYISELGELKRSLPLARRLRAIIAASVGVASISVIALGVAVWPSHEAETVESAWSEFALRQLSNSTRLIDELARPIDDPELESSAQFLEETITTLLEERFGEVNRQILHREYGKAIESLEDIRSWHPPGVYDHLYWEKRRLIRTMADDDLLQSVPDEFTPQGIARLESHIAEYNRLFDDSQLIEEARGAYREKGERQLDVLLADLDTMIMDENKMHEAALLFERATAIAGLLDRKEVISSRWKIWNETLQSRLLDEAEESLHREDLVRSAEYLGRFQPQQAPPTLLTRYEDLRRQVAEYNNQQAYAAVTQLLDEQRYEEAFDREHGIDYSLLDEEEGARLQSELAYARKRYALDEYYDLMAHAESFEDATVTAPQAEETLTKMPRIRAYLPEIVLQSAEDDLLFFEAVSLGKTRRPDAATQRIEDLREQFPTSPYLLAWERLSKADAWSSGSFR